MPKSRFSDWVARWTACFPCREMSATANGSKLRRLSEKRWYLKSCLYLARKFEHVEDTFLVVEVLGVLLNHDLAQGPERPTSKPCRLWSRVAPAGCEQCPIRAKIHVHGVTRLKTGFGYLAAFRAVNFEHAVVAAYENGASVAGFRPPSADCRVE